MSATERHFSLYFWPHVPLQRYHACQFSNTISTRHSGKLQDFHIFYLPVVLTKLQALQSREKLTSPLLLMMLSYGIVPLHKHSMTTLLLKSTALQHVQVSDQPKDYQLKRRNG